MASRAVCRPVHAKGSCSGPHQVLHRRYAAVADRTIRTTIALPTDLLQAVDEMVRAGRVRNRAELIRGAIRRELAFQERLAIDAAFADMSSDAEYQAESERIANEFASADWEALQMSGRTASGDGDATR